MHCHLMLPVVPVTTRLHRWLHKIHNRLLNEICFLDWIQLYRLLGPLNLSRGLKATPGTDASGAEWHGLGVPAEPTNIQLNLAYLSVSISVFQTSYIYIWGIYIHIYIYGKKKRMSEIHWYICISQVFYTDCLVNPRDDGLPVCTYYWVQPAACPKAARAAFWCKDDMALQMTGSSSPGI